MSASFAPIYSLSTHPPIHSCFHQFPPREYQELLHSNLHQAKELKIPHSAHNLYGCLLSLTNAPPHPATTVEEDDALPSACRGGFRLVNSDGHMFKLHILDEERRVFSLFPWTRHIPDKLDLAADT